MRSTQALLIVAAVACALASITPALAQGTTSQWYIGPFQGEVTIQDTQTRGTPGYYYYPQPTQYPTFAERYDRPVRCEACGHWGELGRTCDYCSRAANVHDQRSAQRGAIYSPRAMPGQYWHDRPQRNLIPKARLGWPYVTNRSY